MTAHSDDQDLRERFSQMRRNDRVQVPSFARATMPRAARRNVPLSVAFAIAIVTTLVLSVVFLPRDHATFTIDLRSTRWTAPTDFLLNVPGDWMLRQVPRIATPSLPTDSVTHRRVS